MAPDQRTFSPAEERAAAAWHVVHGAHLAACLALLDARGRQAVVQRDAGAVLAALIACGLEPHWLAPDGGFVRAASLAAALDAAPGARAALVAYGDPDVAALVEAAHGHGAALVLEAAPADAAAALAQGADLVIVADPAEPARGGASAHPPEPARGGAPAHAADTTRGAATAHTADTTRGGAPADPAHAERGGAPAASAAGRDAVAIDATSRFTRRRAPRTGASLLHGHEAERWLPAAAIERAVILAAGQSAPAVPLPPAPPATRPRRFARSVPACRPGPTVCSPRAAWLAPHERVAPAAAVGRIAAEALTPDPPGVPAVLPGERIVPDVVATLRAVLDAGGVVHGAHDDLATLAVVAESPR